MFPRNSSWEIASTLPALIPATASNPTPIHIHVHHEPVRVAYSTVTSLVPKLLPPGNPMHPAPSIVLHLGLAAGRTFFALEKGAHGRGYGEIPDVDGEIFTDHSAESQFPRSEFPPALQTGFDTEDVLVRWKAYLDQGITGTGGEVAVAAEKMQRRPDVRLSDDAGNFMCGFIYWNSLAHYYSLDGKGLPVAFMHVPDLTGSQERLDMGREVAVTLIKALVESKRKVRLSQNAEGVAEWTDQGEDERAETDVNFA